MNDTDKLTNQELIEFLDDWIDLEADKLEAAKTARIPIPEEYDTVTMLTKIKGIVSEYEHLKLDEDIVNERLEPEQSPPPDNDLVELKKKAEMYFNRSKGDGKPVFKEDYLDMCKVVEKICNILLQSRQPRGNAKELYEQWSKEMLEIHGEMTPHYWAAGESMLYWLQSRQPEKKRITREEIANLEEDLYQSHTNDTQSIIISTLLAYGHKVAEK